MKNKNRIGLTQGEKVYYGIINTVIVLLLILCVFPLIYVVCMSFASQQEIFERGSLMIVPYKPTLDAYHKIFSNNSTYIRALGVSVARTSVGTALSVFFSMCLGYALSIKDLPGRRIIVFMVMITVLYSGGLIPTFLAVKDTGLLDTFWAMIIPGLIDTWNALVFKQFFSGLPQDIKESAEVDGCSELRMMFSIVLPMSLPVIAALSLFTAVGHWNSWFDALIYLQTNTDLYPVQLLLRNMFENANLGFTMGGAEVFDINATTSSANTMRMALTVVGVLPILCVYPFLQKYFVKGVYVGAVKG